MDNFYTRHTLAKKIYVATDSEMYTIGTMRFNNVDKTSKKLVEKAMKKLEEEPRGYWYLVSIADTVNKTNSVKRKSKRCKNCKSGYSIAQWVYYMERLENHNFLYEWFSKETGKIIPPR